MKTRTRLILIALVALALLAAILLTAGTQVAFAAGLTSVTPAGAESAPRSSVTALSELSLEWQVVMVLIVVALGFLALFPLFIKPNDLEVLNLDRPDTSEPVDA